MWAIQLYDSRPGIILLREYIIDGRIIVFEEEEMALRLMRQISEKVEGSLNVRLRTVRYSTDPRKDKPCKIPEARLEHYANTMIADL